MQCKLNWKRTEILALQNRVVVEQHKTDFAGFQIVFNIQTNNYDTAVF